MKTRESPPIKQVHLPGLCPLKIVAQTIVYPDIYWTVHHCDK